MKTTLAVLLLGAAAALAQEQSPGTGTPPQQLQNQQPAPPQAQQPAPPQAQQTTPPQSQQPAPPQTQQPTPPESQQQTPPQTQQPAPPETQQTAPPQTQQPTPPQAQQPASPQIVRTNLPTEFNGPTLSEIYCAGFITKQSVHASGTIVAGSNSPEQALYAGHGYLFISGNDVQEGKEYLVLRRTQDPNKYESYAGQLDTLLSLGEIYQDIARIKVLYRRGKVSVAELETSCADAFAGDMVVPFEERPRPEFKHTEFEPFVESNGKTSGRLVMGKDFDTFIGARRIVYLNVGDSQGVKPGDYFRIVRSYTEITENPAESMEINAPNYDVYTKDQPTFDMKTQAGDLPRRSVGELMVLSTTPTSSTALTTFAKEDIHLGDAVEMIEATPIVPEAPAAAAPPQPPTISCATNRSSLEVGDTATITCNGTAEEGHSLTYRYQATADQIAPHDNRATLTATTPGPVTVTATAIDDRDLSAQTTVNLDVQAPTAPPTPTMLNELIFKPNSAYVNNRAKAALDDDALRLQRDASSTMLIEGSVNPSEKEDLAAERAENAKTYLTKSRGIDPSRIQTRAAQSKTGAKVTVILMPAGTNPQ